jgi:hypothetical protein
MNNGMVENYFQETRNAFKYLELDFGYKLISSAIENKEYYPDTVAVVPYMGKKISVEVYWYFASAVINVALIELLKANEVPHNKNFWGAKKPGEARAIKLQTLLDMRGESDLLMLKKIRSTKMSDIKKRGILIRENLSAVMKNVAQVLREQAHDVLLGDTTIFSDVQEHEEKLLRKEYPAHFEQS